MASPHTRGWTRLRDRLRDPLAGFPAHAGMDPLTPAAAAARVRLPRTRGDGPCRSRCATGRSGASPHTRGWTAPPQPGQLLDAGFPAHAGMDLGLRIRQEHALGLPRTRGDGPAQNPAAATRPRASPHTRGWTLHRAAHGGDAGGFPAHAGMDRSRSPRRRRRRRLPRTRGDGPHYPGPPPPEAVASPHTRGWTRRRRLVEEPLPGFPAHAGMDPRRPATRRYASAASPHTRGWTRARLAGLPSPAGFPAHAGMAPWRPWVTTRSSWLPRTRGGWTPPEPGARPSVRGFPAHAGMDPTRRPWS